MFFVGENTLKLDSKGRLTIPAKHRDKFVAGCVLSYGYDGEPTLNLYDTATFQKVGSQFKKLPFTKEKNRRLQRKFFSQSEELSLDKAGRILLPAAMRESIGIANEVVFAGVGSHVELWAPDRWHATTEGDDDDALFEALDMALSDD